MAWVREHPHLPRQWAAELNAFKAEAEKLLGAALPSLPADPFAPGEAAPSRGEEPNGTACPGRQEAGHASTWAITIGAQECLVTACPPRRFSSTQPARPHFRQFLQSAPTPGDLLEQPAKSIRIDRETSVVVSMARV